MSEQPDPIWPDLQENFGERTATVPPDGWIAALEQARDLGYTFFDWLSAVDEEAEGFTVYAHVARTEGEDRGDRMLLRTRIPNDKAELPTATTVFRGANWHERETHEMFGIGFTGHPNLVPLLLPDGFEGHPLRKDFVLAARVAKEWPGVKEPGEGGPGHGAPEAGGRRPTAARRRMVPPGVPDNWLKPLPEPGSEPSSAPSPDPDAKADEA